MKQIAAIKIKDKQLHYNVKNRSQIKSKRKQYYEKNKTLINFVNSQRQKSERSIKHSNSDRHYRLKQFWNSMKFGLSYTCTSCHRLMFKDSVSKWNKTFPAIMQIDIDNHSTLFVCSTCRSHLVKKKLPPMSFVNGLKVEDVPECLLGLSELESVLIA